MSPVAGKGQSNVRTTMIVAVAGVVAAAALLFLVTRLASSGNVELRIGDEHFNAGQVGRISTEIDDRGPVLYSDVGGGSRDIWLNHTGDDPETRWVAFDARAIDASRECTVEWVLADGVFVDPCNGATFGPTGDGLAHYAVTIDEGDVVVDLSVRVANTP